MIRFEPIEIALLKEMLSLKPEKVRVFPPAPFIEPQVIAPVEPDVFWILVLIPSLNPPVPVTVPFAATVPAVIVPIVAFVPKKFVDDAVVAKKFVVVAAVPVAFWKVTF